MQSAPDRGSTSTGAHLVMYMTAWLDRKVSPPEYSDMTIRVVTRNSLQLRLAFSHHFTQLVLWTLLKLLPLEAFICRNDIPDSSLVKSMSLPLFVSFPLANSTLPSPWMNTMMLLMCVLGAAQNKWLCQHQSCCWFLVFVLQNAALDSRTSLLFVYNLWTTFRRQASK